MSLFKHYKKKLIDSGAETVFEPCDGRGELNIWKIVINAYRKSPTI